MTLPCLIISQNQTVLDSWKNACEPVHHLVISFGTVVVFLTLLKHADKTNFSFTAAAQWQARITHIFSSTMMLLHFWDQVCSPN